MFNLRNSSVATEQMLYAPVNKGITPPPLLGRNAGFTGLVSPFKGRLYYSKYPLLTMSFLLTMMVVFNSIAQFNLTGLRDRTQLGTVGNAGTRNTGTDSYATDPGPQQCVNTTSDCDNHRRWVVNVADGSHPIFSWAFRGPTNGCNGTIAGWAEGFIDLDNVGYALNCDPDVVIAEMNHEIFATVVGIAADGAPGFGRILVQSYIWQWSTQNSGAFFPHGCISERPLYLGITWEAADPNNITTSGLTLGRRCLSPNIDANSDGQIAIVWTEYEQVQVTVTWGWPFNFTTVVPVNKGNAFTINGFVNGTSTDGKQCLCALPACRNIPFRQYPNGATQTITDIPLNGDWGRRILYEDRCGGIPIGTPFELGLNNVSLMSYYSNTDVSIAEMHENDEGRFSIVSYTFYKYGFNPDPAGVPNPRGLVVSQEDWSLCYFNNRQLQQSAEGDFWVYPEQLITTQVYWRRTGFGGVLGAPPRIASPATSTGDNFQDWTLVMGNVGGFCDGEIGDVIISPVRVWGRRDKSVTDNGVDLNVPANEVGFLNVNAVVSYWNIRPENRDRFNVAWAASEVRNTGSDTEPGRLWDIIVKAYELNVAGGLGSLNAYPQATSGTTTIPAYNGEYSIVNRLRPGTQNAPSISGRRFMDYSSYGFSNTNPLVSTWKMACNSSVSLPLNCCGLGVGPGESEGESFRKAFDFGKIEVEPNPSEGLFKIYTKLEKDESIIASEVSDAKGKATKVQAKKVGTNGNQLEWRAPADYAKGIYILKITTSKGGYTQKLILE